LYSGRAGLATADAAPILVDTQATGGNEEAEE
jgi:hypothetical protein